MFYMGFFYNTGFLVYVLVSLTAVAYLVYSKQSLKKTNRKYLDELKKQQIQFENAEKGFSQQELLAKNFQRDLWEHQKSLISVSLSLEKLNSFLVDILKRVQYINLHTNDEGIRKELCEIISSINLRAKENTPIHFEHLYASANGAFIRSLRDAHPGLTPQENRLCVFLHMNLSTKEIADITMQNCKAIEMARHRLRKKLGLKRCDNLNTYLASFSD